MSAKSPLSDAPLPSSSAQSTTTTQGSLLATSPELEQTLVSLTSHRSVLGYMLLSRGQPVTMIRHSGVIFEGEKGKKYASAISRIVESVQAGLEDDEVKFMRIRTKRHEIMISPGRHGRYLLAVLHDPTS
ncbi:hypothetical protein BC629DRAFT_1276240 [Irpex lacteus]|nr:hypothetical protein BC629DRAFT_1276240 [Irpex lacteus]